MKPISFFLVFLSFGHVAPGAVQSTEDDATATTSLLLRPDILGRNPSYALSKRAGPDRQAGHDKHLAQPANLEPTNPKEPSRRKPPIKDPSTSNPKMRKPYRHKSSLNDPSTSEPSTSKKPTNAESTMRKTSERKRYRCKPSTGGPSTSKPSTSDPSKSDPSSSKPTGPRGPRIKWAKDWGTKHVRRFPITFLPWGTQDKDWDTHVCEALRRKGITSCHAKIVPGSKLGTGPTAPRGAPYTVVSNIWPLSVPLSRGFKDLELKKKPLVRDFNAMPLVRGFNEMYISHDGSLLPTRPKDPPPPGTKDRLERLTATATATATTVATTGRDIAIGTVGLVCVCLVVPCFLAEDYLETL